MSEELPPPSKRLSRGPLLSVTDGQCVPDSESDKLFVTTFADNDNKDALIEMDTLKPFLINPDLCSGLNL